MKQHEKEVVKIKHKDGYAIINKEDYNDKEHEFYKEVIQKIPVENKKKKDNSK